MPSDQTTGAQRVACRSVGTKQCAAICLSHSCLIPLGECPEAALVWTDEAIAQERVRRPDDPNCPLVMEVLVVAADAIERGDHEETRDE